MTEAFQAGDLAIVDGEVSRIVYYGLTTTERAEWTTLTKGPGLAQHSELIRDHSFVTFAEGLHDGAAGAEASALDAAIADAVKRSVGPGPDVRSIGHFDPVLGFMTWPAE